MIVMGHYESPIGEICLAAEDGKLCNLWFAEQKYEPHFQVETEEALPVFQETRRWLDLYFEGKDPGFFPPLQLSGSPFRQMVGEIMLEIPFGETTTYGEIAREAAERLGKESMSAQAVGGAVGHNPIGIIVPCHRVLGKDGTLTGYAGGLDRKEFLLNLEHILYKRN